MAKAGGPVRDGQAGVVTGYQAAGDDQQKGQRGNKDSESVVGSVVCRRTGQNNSWKLTILAFASQWKNCQKRRNCQRIQNSKSSPRITPITLIYSEWGKCGICLDTNLYRIS
ncbi:MAG TPA: hypothetical protein VIB39_08175 [Candidatus Angelobacter sp.]|jgi:hypothetical protein